MDKITTNTAGVRCRVHKTRKHGVKFDRYFTIRYRFDGKLKEEGIGWTFEGWTEKKAAAILAELKANQTKGEPTFTLPHLEKLKKNMNSAGKAPRTVRYALDIVRQVYNHADLKNIYRGRNPATGHRSLSPAEEGQLLYDLLKKSQDVHDMSLLSLQAGLRYGEVASLRWGAVDIFNGQAVLVDTKSNKNLAFFMTPAVKAMFGRRQPPGGMPDALVFPNKYGNRQARISNSFLDVTDSLFNQGVTDPREKVVFHSLRRTFATRLLKQGTSLYSIQRLLGHADITTTTRYLDVSGDDLREEVLKLQQG